MGNCTHSESRAPQMAASSPKYSHQMPVSAVNLADFDTSFQRFADTGLPYRGEFLYFDMEVSHRFNPIPGAGVVALLAWHGFLPMGHSYNMLLGKLHQRRCVVKPGEVHINRKTRRLAKRGYRFSVNTRFDDVVKGIQQYTYSWSKSDCWLSDALARCYKAVNDLDEDKRHGVRFHSVELCDASGSLVAGEMGYTCGAVYTSCTGFALKEQHPGSGTLQLAALARWLLNTGFELWDLGMEMSYKTELGARGIPRKDWVRQLRILRIKDVKMVYPIGDDANALIAKVFETKNGAQGDSEKQ